MVIDIKFPPDFYEFKRSEVELILHELLSIEAIVTALLIKTEGNEDLSFFLKQIRKKAGDLYTLIQKRMQEEWEK